RHHPRKRVIQYSRDAGDKPRSRGVLDTPLSRSMTVECGSSRASRPHRLLLIQPDILEPQAVVLAVVVRGVTPDIGLPAIDGDAGEDDRARGVVDQEALDLPDDLPALVLVELARLR